MTIDKNVERLKQDLEYLKLKHQIEQEIMVLRRAAKDWTLREHIKHVMTNHYDCYLSKKE